MIVNKKNPLPDLMFSLYAIHIISSRAYDSFKENNICGFIAHPIKVYDNNGQSVEMNYYSVEYTGKLAIDYNKMGVDYVKCYKCMNSFVANPSMTYDNLYLDDNSWDGSDLCIGGFCTKKLLDIVNKKKLQGFMFKPAVDAWNPSSKTEIIIK